MTERPGEIVTDRITNADGSQEYSFHWEGGNYVDFSREFFDYVDREYFETRGEYPRLEPGWEFRIGPFWLRMLGDNGLRNTITAKWLSGDREKGEK